MEACSSEQSVWAQRKGSGELELTFQVKKEKPTKNSSGLSSHTAQSNQLLDGTADGIPGSFCCLHIQPVLWTFRIQREMVASPCRTWLMRGSVVPSAAQAGSAPAAMTATPLKRTVSSVKQLPRAMKRSLDLWWTAHLPVCARTWITTVQDELTQGGSALRKLPQLLLWDLPEPEWLLGLATLAWHSHAMATAWPGPYAHVSPLVHGCTTRSAGKAGGWREETTNLHGDETVSCPYGCRDALGDLTSGAGAGGLHRMGKQPLLFKTVYSSPETSWWWIFAVCHTQTQTKATAWSTPGLDLVRKAPCPSTLKHSLRGEALGGLCWEDSRSAPCGAGASALLWTSGCEAQWDNEPRAQAACAPQGTPKSFWSHPPASPGQPPVTAEHGEPLPLEIPRMSWANHWANIFSREISPPELESS